ncbi:MAG: YabP/YqfC family sporulation protein [Oscillospiraceae bacterium]|jgi:sporulation protein YabP|nr:YabP/YqfC family sporulation protein [Oscillospiraceae bacterium]
MQDLILESKKKLTLSGITEVDCFDERDVRLFTKLGELSIQGKGLHINSMSIETGDMIIEGEINAIVYGNSEVKSPLTFLGKLFK